MSTGICAGTRLIDHHPGPHHPERPDRFRAIHRALREAALLTSPDPFPDFRIDLGRIEKSSTRILELPEPEPVSLEHLQRVHPAGHIARIRKMSEDGGGVVDQGDTVVDRNSYDIARRSVGGVLQCCDAVVGGTVRRAFAAVRPPGHHAEPDRAMGFCLFSNIAIAARYLQKIHRIGRIAIVDFDVHHGNGTQACFEEDPGVYFVSLHQHPQTCYPGTGYDWERGKGAGEGFTLNLPFRPGGGDEEYRRALQEKVIPQLDQFRPEFLLLSAGFDAHRDDPLAQMELSEAFFGEMTRTLVECADRHCAGRVVSTLEGGYDLRALGRSVVQHVRALSE